uniref:Secreted protein n=1 Tax=Macaca nemestrina TaxID=9545 RepID=A0A2K6AMS0_MACNE
MGCAGLLQLFAGAIGLPSLSLPREPAIHRTLRLVPLPRLARVSLLPSPQRYHELFFIYNLCQDATPNPLSLRCAPRSSLLLAWSSLKEWRGGEPRTEEPVRPLLLPQR